MDLLTHWWTTTDHLLHMRTVPDVQGNDGVRGRGL